MLPRLAGLFLLAWAALAHAAPPKLVVVIVVDGLPPKVSLRSEPGTVAAPAAWRAMRAAPMTRPLAPKVENLTRT